MVVDGTSQAPWRACYTRSRHEKKVSERLERAGFEVFLPLVDQKREWHDRATIVEMPLFPSYLFARFDGCQLGQVMRTAGVATVVRFHGRLAAVPSHEIENIRRQVSGLDVSGHPLERRPALEDGDRVRVVERPFEGVEGIVAERRGERRVLVGGSETLGQGLKLELSVPSLEAVA